MQKPQLSDFGLIENNLSTYETQMKNYKSAIELQYSMNNQYNKKLKRYSIIFSIITAMFFIILLISIFYYDSLISNAQGIFLGSLVCAIWLIPFIIGVINWGKGNNISNLFVVPFIGIGTLIYELYEKKNIDIRSRYIDSSNEQKIQKYKDALERYKDATEKSRPTYWQQLSPYQFEAEVANLFVLLGYSASVTKSSGDGGVDVVMNKDGQRIGVQCKHHSRPVGPAAVRELIGVVQIKNFDYGIFVSLNGFTATVRSEIRNLNKRIELISCNDLCELVKTVKFGEEYDDSHDIDWNDENEIDEDEILAKIEEENCLEELGEDLKKSFAEIITQHPTFKKIQYSLNDINAIIKMSFSNIKSKGITCEEMQNTIKDRSKNSRRFDGSKNKFSFYEVMSLITMSIANIGLKKLEARLLIMAEQGNPSAQYKLGLRYFSRGNFQKKDEKAIEWLKKAAEQDHAEAQCNLGVRYARGISVGRNKNEACYWLKRSAKLGYSDAKSFLEEEF